MTETNPWIQLAQGHWTRERPTKPGCYFVCSAAEFMQGKDPGHQTIDVVDNGFGALYYTETGFRGYWWSVPIPRLPAIPQ